MLQPNLVEDFPVEGTRKPLKEVYAAAEKVTVYWCPIVYHSTGAVLEACSQDSLLRVCRTLAGGTLGSKWPAVFESLLRHIPREPDHSTPSGACVAFVAEGDGLSWDRELGSVSGRPVVSFGIWEDVDSAPTDWSWFPEVNICKTYKRPANLNWESFLNVLRSLGGGLLHQNAVFCLLGGDAGETGLTVRMEDGRVEDLGQAQTWQLHTLERTSWDDVCQLLVGELRPRSLSATFQHFLVAEMAAVGSCNGNGLGATFAMVKEDETRLQITNCRGARFLFLPSFWCAQAGECNLFRLPAGSSLPPNFGPLCQLHWLGSHNGADCCPGSPGRNVSFSAPLLGSNFSPAHRCGLCEDCGHNGQQCWDCRQQWPPQPRSWLPGFFHD
jgi:hypothetical protein